MPVVLGLPDWVVQPIGHLSVGVLQSLELSKAFHLLIPPMKPVRHEHELAHVLVGEELCTAEKDFGCQSHESVQGEITSERSSVGLQGIGLLEDPAHCLADGFCRLVALTSHSRVLERNE